MWKATALLKSPRPAEQERPWLRYSAPRLVGMCCRLRTLMSQTRGLRLTLTKQMALNRCLEQYKRSRGRRRLGSEGRILWVSSRVINSGQFYPEKLNYTIEIPSFPHYIYALHPTHAPVLLDFYHSIRTILLTAYISRTIRLTWNLSYRFRFPAFRHGSVS